MRHAAAHNDYDRLAARVRHVRALHGDTTPRRTAVPLAYRRKSAVGPWAILAVCWALCIILPFASGLHMQAIGSAPLLMMWDAGEEGAATCGATVAAWRPTRRGASA